MKKEKMKESKKDSDKSKSNDEQSDMIGRTMSIVWNLNNKQKQISRTMTGSNFALV